MSAWIKIIAFLAMLLATAGCKETIHADLTEREANEIVAVLFAEGISASKDPLKKGLYSVTVAKPDFGIALSILTKSGLPRQSFNTIGDVFPDDSVVGTAFEERARFSFALSEELARTLTEIEGVQHARVHVVIPEKGRFEETAPQAKAALAIYHKPAFDKVLHVPQIKKLVAFSVPNLLYDDVSVSLFPAGALSDTSLIQAVPNGSAIAAGANIAAGLTTMDNDLVSILLIALAMLTGVFVAIRVLHSLWSFLTRSVSDAD